MIDIPLNKARFMGDIELQETIKQDENLVSQISSDVFEKQGRKLRKTFLANAVRVDERLLPKLDSSFKSLKKRAGLDTELEAFVFAEPTIQAFVTASSRSTFVALSSAAVNKLSKEELEFVIGHELGHAIFGHVNFQSMDLMNSEAMDIRSRMQVMAWQRATEISADRCGLVCCGSIDVAASAIFRTLSGLDSQDLNISPKDFTEPVSYTHLTLPTIYSV